MLYHHFPPAFIGIPLTPSSYRLAECSAQWFVLLSTGSEQTIRGESRADCTGPLGLMLSCAFAGKSMGNSRIYQTEKAAGINS